MTSLPKILLLVLVTVASSQSDAQKCGIKHTDRNASCIALMVYVRRGIFVMSKNSASVMVIMVAEWYVMMRIFVQLYWTATV